MEGHVSNPAEMGEHFCATVNGVYPSSDSNVVSVHPHKSQQRMLPPVPFSSYTADNNHTTILLPQSCQKK